MNKNCEESHEELTTTLVADGAISEVASLGDGHGYLRPDPSALCSIRQHDCTEAARVLAQLLHSGAAPVRDLSLWVLRC